MLQSEKLRLTRGWFPTLLIDHELVCIDQTDVGDQQRAKVDHSREHGVEIDVNNCVGFTVEDGIEFGKDGSHGGDVLQEALIDFENRQQIIIDHELYFETVARLLFVGPEDFEGPAIVGRDEQVVSVSMGEVAFQADEVLLDHSTHCIIRRVAPAVEWDVNQGFGGHRDSVT